MSVYLRLFTLFIILSLNFSCGNKEDTSGLVGGGTPAASTPTEEGVNPDGPIINSFIEPANGTYANGGGILLFQVNFDEAVVVTGTPRIPIRLGLTTVYADYQTGSGTAGLVNTSSGITDPTQVTGVATAPTTSNTSLSIAWAVPNNNGTNLINYTV